MFFESEQSCKVFRKIINRKMPSLFSSVSSLRLKFRGFLLDRHRNKLDFFRRNRFLKPTRFPNHIFRARQHSQCVRQYSQDQSQSNWEGFPLSQVLQCIFVFLLSPDNLEKRFNPPIQLISQFGDLIPANFEKIKFQSIYHSEEQTDCYSKCF